MSPNNWGVMTFKGGNTEPWSDQSGLNPSNGKGSCELIYKVLSVLGLGKELASNPGLLAPQATALTTRPWLFGQPTNKVLSI